MNLSESIKEYYKKFTGEDTFEEAKVILNNDIPIFVRKIKEHESYINMISDCLFKYTNRINSAKKHIKGVLFVHLAEQLKWIKDVEIDESFIKEIYNRANLIESPKFRQKSGLFLIDFDEHSFKSNALAILSGGFWTRKKAEVVKQIALQLEELIDIYERMLVLLDNSIKYLMVKCIGFNHKMERVSIKNLPSQQQKEIVVLVAMSSILNDIVNTSFTIDANEATTEWKRLNILHDNYVKKYQEAV